MTTKLRKLAKPCLWLWLIGSFFLLKIQSAECNSDWLQSCSVCHCFWNSGKKTADCKSRSFTALPTDMSSEMQVIDLSNNFIAEIRRNEFLEANMQSVHKLFMRNCTVQELSKDALKGLDLLFELDMSHNYIRTLHPGTFTGPNRLRTIIMNHNEIEVLDNYLFQNLTILSRVEFKYNKLKHIGTEAFGELPKLVAVYLESNKLNVLYKETFLRTPKLLYISLAQNPWNCTCDLQEFRDFTLTKRLYTAPTSCYDPPIFRGKLWTEVPSENFACKPRILGSVRSFIEAHSYNISLPCRIQSSPRPNITWIFNKRPLNTNDYRIKIINSDEQNHSDSPGASKITSELHIYGVRASDKGRYVCVASNRGGRVESEFQLIVKGNKFSTLNEISEHNVVGENSDTQSNGLLISCLIITTLLLFLVIIVLVVCWYCKRLRTYQKNATSNKIVNKADKSHSSSMVEGSVIKEMQKSLLTDINPVEKPPRRTDLEGVDATDETIDIKRNLLNNSMIGKQHQQDDETHSTALSDTILSQKARRGFVEENCGISLPPDLLAFPARLADTSPLMQSSNSFMPDECIYGIRSPSLTSPVYAQMSQHSIYGKKTLDATSSNGFMTLQHPKSRNLAHIALANSHQRQQQCSPFLPAPVIYSLAPSVSAVLKHGYMTIPRKPRTPSWAPSSISGTQCELVGEFQSAMSPNLSEAGTKVTLDLQSEPVYDNLGLRTTIGGNSTLNLQKDQHSEPAVRYTMRDRPLPATPSLSSEAFGSFKNDVIHRQNAHYLPSLSPKLSSSNNTPFKIYEPIQDLTGYQESNITLDTQLPNEMKQPSCKLNAALKISSEQIAKSSCNELPRVVKIPPRPPPKPKKKMSVSTTRSGQGSTSQLFDDEGEDGTEV